MKFLMFILSLFITHNALAGSQYVQCTNPEIEISVCWQTSGAVILSSAEGSEELKWLPFELDGQSVFANSNRSLLVQSNYDIPWLLIDGAGKKFQLQCGFAENGICPRRISKRF